MYCYFCTFVFNLLDKVCLEGKHNSLATLSPPLIPKNNLKMHFLCFSKKQEKFELYVLNCSLYFNKGIDKFMSLKKNK